MFCDEKYVLLLEFWIMVSATFHDVDILQKVFWLLNSCCWLLYQFCDSRTCFILPWLLSRWFAVVSSQTGCWWGQAGPLLYFCRYLSPGNLTNCHFVCAFAVAPAAARFVKCSHQTTVDVHLAGCLRSCRLRSRPLLFLVVFLSGNGKYVSGWRAWLPMSSFRWEFATWIGHVVGAVRSVFCGGNTLFRPCYRWLRRVRFRGCQKDLLRLDWRSLGPSEPFLWAWYDCLNDCKITAVDEDIKWNVQGKNDDNRSLL